MKQIVGLLVTALIQEGSKGLLRFLAAAVGWRAKLVSVTSKTPAADAQATNAIQAADLAAESAVQFLSSTATALGITAVAPRVFAVLGLQ